MATHLYGDAKEIPFTRHLDEKELGFIKVLYGRYSRITATLDFVFSMLRNKSYTKSFSTKLRK